MSFSAAQLAPHFIPEIGHFSEGLPKDSMTRFLPLAIAADPVRLEKEGTKYALELGLKLYMRK
jgi:hypothetical protein